MPTPSPNKKESAFLNHLQKLEQLAAASKWKRFKHHPAKYLFAQLHRKLLYRFTGPIQRITKTFWNEDFHIILPAGMDIYLTGGKTHSSEIRLARYACKYLKEDTIIMDIGAHFGYYSLLFSALAPKGQVYSFEPSPASFQVLQKNASEKNNCHLVQSAVSDWGNNEILFFEYDALHSEYNTVDDAQFSKQNWRKKIKPKAIPVSTTSIDDFCQEHAIIPGFIKIDVEGSEFKVIHGGLHILQQPGCIVSMEFLCNERGNQSHRDADALLKSSGYSSFKINDEGDTEIVSDIPSYLEQRRLESDNIIYQRKSH